MNLNHSISTRPAYESTVRILREADLPTEDIGTAHLRRLSHAEEQAKASGIRELYLLTTTAETFFAKRGFLRAPRDSAPPAIRATREFSGICPASSAFMSKRL
jgi:N-acetylglutamate synthase-like GNAT family acetyltransferase